MTPAVIEQIKSRLPESKFEALRSETRSMPGWMSDAFIRFEHHYATAG